MILLNNFNQSPNCRNIDVYVSNKICMFSNYYSKITKNPISRGEIDRFISRGSIKVLMEREVR